MYFSAKEIFDYYGDVEYVNNFQPYDKNEFFKEETHIVCKNEN